MAGRPPAPSSVNRDTAFPSPPPPPPETAAARQPSQSHSPVMRTTRSTRSRSRDLGENNAPASVKKAPQRGAREVSVGSINSVDNDATLHGTDRRKRKVARAVTRSGVVAEDQEEPILDHSTKSTDEIQKILQSPGGMSGMSGTTALTTQSAQELEELDAAMILELLPDLWRDTEKLLNILAPKGTSVSSLESTVKRLHIPGTREGNRLRHTEKTFESTKENYGTDIFIDPALILRKLFDDHDLGENVHRLNIVLQAANIAALIKGLLVADPESPETLALLTRLNKLFPTPFLSGYAEELQFGSSALLDDTFALALGLRSQMSIATLREYREDPGYDPDRLLVQLFYEPVEGQSQTDSHEDILLNGHPRRIAGLNTEMTPESSEFLNSVSSRILQQYESIHANLYHEADATENGDRVNFEQLDDQFPWIEFLANVVDWGQSRMAEIRAGIIAYGGVDRITKSLVDAMKTLDSQIEVYSEDVQPDAVAAAKELQPAAETIPASTGGKSLLSRRTAKLLGKRKSISSSAGPPSNQQQRADTGDHASSVSGLLGGPQADLHQGSQSRERVTKLAEMPSNRGSTLVEEHESVEELPRSTAKIVDILTSREEEKNKENRFPCGESGISKRKRTLYDRQDDAHRVQWDTQAEDDGIYNDRSPAQSSRRTIEAKAADGVEYQGEDEVSEDEGFQQAREAVDPRRRAQAPVAPSRAPILASQSQDNGPRADHNERSQHQLRRPRQLQTRARAEDSEEAFDDIRSHSYQEINDVARAVSSLKGIKLQKRTPWSLHDTELLIRRIGRHGCSWSNIEKMGGFERVCDQVGLKDKARNIKVDYLKAGTPLPLNFDRIAIGAKERAKVMAAGMNPYRLEGEALGEESIGMDGQPTEI
ncbi:MAG: hypothetical protein M1818_008304 [Claussenomyces sp. TS43310]|nr:MAG: hypothetical protein M1818_008304 [Claussenomyces sp. TS43310]